MHEAIVTRGNVQGNFYLETLIFVEENCVLVHPGGKNYGTCHLKAHSREGREQCIRHLLTYNNKDDILAWLLSLNDEMKSTFPLEKIEEVNRVWRSMPIDHRHTKKEAHDE